MRISDWSSDVCSSDLLVVLKVDDKSVVGSWDYGKDYYFQRVTWANNERILYATSFKTGRFDFQVGLRDLYTSDIDGSSRMVIPHGNFYGIVDNLPGERDSGMVTRSQGHTLPFKPKCKHRKKNRQKHGKGK